MVLCAVAGGFSDCHKFLQHSQQPLAAVSQQASEQHAHPDYANFNIAMSPANAGLRKFTNSPKLVSGNFARYRSACEGFTQDVLHVQPVRTGGHVHL